MPLSRDPLLAEIDDDLRAERLRRLWNSLGSYILAISVLILLGTAGIVGWKQHQEGRAQELTGKLIEAAQMTDQEKPKEALPLLRNVAGSDDPSIAAIARLWLAENTRAGDPAASRRWLEPLLARPVGDDAYRQYAALLAADAKGFAALKEADLAGPFGHTLREERALAFLSTGDKVRAAADFRFLSQDARTPASMRERATQMLATVLADMPPTAPAARKQ